MKKNLTKRIALALAFLLIFVNLFTVSAFAMPALEEEAPKGIVDWEISKDFKTLTNKTEGVEYRLYDPLPSTLKVFGTVYVYRDAITWNFSEKHTSESLVYRPYDYKDVVWLDFGGSRYYYVTEEGKARLDALRQGEIGKYRWRWEALSDYQKEEFPEKIINDGNRDLENGNNVEEVDTRLLDNCPSYYIEAFDLTGSFSFYYAAIFEIEDDKYLYVKLSDLDPKALDQYGCIDYGSALNITMANLSDFNSATIRFRVNGERESLDPHYEYEIKDIPHDSDDYEESDGNMTGIIVFSSALFWLSVIVVGFVAPLPLLVLGCALAFIKKLGRPKYWISVSAFALLWMLFAALFSLIIILIILI